MLNRSGNQDDAVAVDGDEDLDPGLDDPFAPPFIPRFEVALPLQPFIPPIPLVLPFDSEERLFCCW